MMHPSNRPRPPALFLSLVILVFLAVSFLACHVEASTTPSADGTADPLTEEKKEEIALPARVLSAWEIPCAARERDYTTSGGSTKRKGQVYEALKTRMYQSLAQWEEQANREEEERVKNPDSPRPLRKDRYRVVRIPVQPFFTNEFMFKFLMDDRLELDLKEECVRRRDGTWLLVTDVRDWVNRAVSKDRNLWYPVVIGLVDVLKLDTTPKRYLQHMMGQFPNELKENVREEERQDDGEGEDEGKGSQKSFTVPEFEDQLDWTNQEYDEDQVLVRINLRRLEKGIALFHYLLRYLPIEIKTELGPSKLQELVDLTTTLREQVRAILTCEGVHHVTPSEIESMQCPDPEAEVKAKIVRNDDRWLDLHIGYEVSSRFRSLYNALAFDMPFEWEAERMMMMTTEDYPPQCGRRGRLLGQKAKLAKEEREQRLAKGSSLPSSSWPSSMSSMFPPAREPFKWTNGMISQLSAHAGMASRACHYGAPSKRAAILF